VLPLLAAGLIQANVLISAGHEGRPASCAQFPKHKCNLGAAGEREWTPIVADEAVRVLRQYGLTVIREPADFEGQFAVDAAVFIHFDGTTPPCASGASIGYHHPSDLDAAVLWKKIYAPIFPFRFMPDNFTLGLRDYYGFRQVEATHGALVLELGEISCPEQRAWMEPRLLALGDLIAYAVSREIGKGDVPFPATFASDALP
jgi:hypothetical protein